MLDLNKAMIKSRKKQAEKKGCLELDYPGQPFKRELVPNQKVGQLVRFLTYIKKQLSVNLLPYPFFPS